LIVVYHTVKKLQNTWITGDTYRRCYNILFRLDVAWCVMPSCSLIKLRLCDEALQKCAHCLQHISAYPHKTTPELLNWFSRNGEVLPKFVGLFSFWLIWQE